MHRSKRVANGLAVATLLLIALLAVAEQAPKAQTVEPAAGSNAKSSPRDSSTGMSSGRQDQTGKATGRTELNSRSSGHATESLDVNKTTGETETVSKGQKSSNPLHVDHGNAGTNPLYDSKGKIEAKPAASTVQPYKDGEDGTMRTGQKKSKTTTKP